MAIFVPNSPLAGFNIGTGSLQGPVVVLDSLTGASTSTFLIAGGAVGDEFFISASNFNVKANGNITASNALLSGTITATAGFIGGWTIGSTTLQGGNVVLDSTGNVRTATNFTTGDGFFLNDQPTNNFRVGLAGGSRLQFTGQNIEIYDSNTRVVSLGIVNEIAGFGLTPAAISSSNNQLVLRSNGQITGSNVLFNGGRIGGFTLSGDAFSGTNFYISGSATGDNFFISSSNFNVKANGNVTGSNVLFTGGRIGGFTISGDSLSNSTNFYISGSASGNGFFISSSRFNVKANGDVTGSQVLFTGGTIASFTLSNNALTAGSTFFISSSVSGTPSTAFFISSSRFNVKQDGTITGSNVLFNGGTVGGFTIDSSKITGTNIIIDSAGSLQTSNYASDLTGWRISAAGNGFAEFENVKIRGTLSTAVFEKQSVNAVGGQLYIANSTTLTGSAEAGASATGQYTSTQTTMSVENVTGFEVGEIITAKKFSGTGFGTEYMLINSASRANPSSDTDFSGRIYVTRGYGSGTSGNSGSLGETPGAGQSYSGSQVIVSTGKLGTGFIRINASPNDQATPYIDIVERTGSGIYDVALKARLGDLSGLANSSYVFGSSNPGFGLATNNVFLQGGIIANTGSIGGIQMANNKLFTGTGAFNNNNTGFYLDASSNFSLGNKLSWNGSILSVSGTLNATDGNIGGFAITRDAITGSAFYLSGSAANNGTSFFLSSSRFNIKGNGDVTGSQVLFTGGRIGGFDMTSTQISDTLGDLVLKSDGQITASNMLLNGGVIRSANYTTTAGSEINLADGTFDFGGSSVYYPGIRFDGSALSIKGDVTADTGNFLNVTVRGSIATTFFTGSNAFSVAGAIQKTALESWTTSSGNSSPTTGWKPITTGSLMSGSVSGISFRLPWKAPRFLWNVDLSTPTETLTNIIRSCSYDQGPLIGSLQDSEWSYSADSTLYGLSIGTEPYRSGLSFRPQTSGSVGANQWNFTTGSWQGIRLENVALTGQTVSSVSRPLETGDSIFIIGFTPDTNRSITARVIVKASSTYGTGGQTTSPFYVTTYEGAESEAFVLKIPLSGIVGYAQNRGAAYFEIDNGKVDIEVQWKFTGYLGTAPTGVSSVRLHEAKILGVPRIENLAVRNFSIGNGLKSAIVFEPVYPVLGTTANPSGEVRLRNPSYKEDTTNGFHDLTVRNSTLMGNTDTVLSVGATASLFGTPTALIYNSKTGTEADAQLEIGGDGYSGVHYLDSSAYTIGQNSGVRAVRIYSNTTATGVVLGPGSSSWSSYSDERLKENISPILNSIDKIKNVRCVYYDLKDVDSSGTANRIGVIAQDLTGSLPQVVDTIVHPNNGTSYLSVKYTELIPVLLKAIQEQQETIANLQLRITALESGSL